MNKLKWGALLFIILVFVLASWPSFLAFNQAEQVATEQQTLKKMSIALVNEDRGAAFNDEHIDFGQEFVRSIERDDTHNWFIVSRGVAENGIEQNLYNMMIVIPHDFTEKVLSIDSDSPEKVQLSYKINASDNQELRSQARETATSILNEFNRRIIDVYFASVIGNLQEAQDSVQDIVEREAHFTNTYNQHVHSPLADYTSQFSVVQDYTQHSRESFDNFKDILGMFEENLYDGVNTNEQYVSNFSDMLDMHERHHQFTQTVNNDIHSLHRSMQHDDVLTRLHQLEQATDRVHRQFQWPQENRRQTILSRGYAVQRAFNEAIEKVESVEQHLNDLLADQNKELRKELEKAFDGEFNEIFTSNDLYREPNRAVLNQVYEHIAKLPTLNEAEIIELGFESEERPNTTNRLMNVIQVTNKFLNEEEFRRRGFHPPNRDIPLVKLVEDVQRELRRSGVIGVDTVQLPLRDAEGKELTQFTLTDYPDEFWVRSVKLSVPDSDWSHEIRRYRGQTIAIPANVEGELQVEVTFRLSRNADIDVFEPIYWSWNVQEERTIEESRGDQQAESNQTKDEMSEPVQGQGDDNEREVQVAESDEEVEPLENGSNEESIQPEAPIETKVRIENNTAMHKVATALLQDAKGKFINEAAETVASYERLLSLYELYFGLDMTQLPHDFEEQTLSELATEDSLYHLFNKTEIVDVLIDAIIDSMTENAAQLVEHVNSDIARFNTKLDEAKANADRMVRTLNETRAQAEILNESVAKTLEDLAKWREDSLDLIAGQEQVLLNEEEEIATITALDQEFKAFLAQSQALAEQANANLTSADHVYDTLEAIDNHAQQIQENGASIVNQADTLSTELINRLHNDQNFADNFVNVLANSRIGDRPNEDLYSFLSEPVQVKNDGIIMAGDTLTPYFLILIMFIVALFTAYVISTYAEQRARQADGEVSLMQRNVPITIITASIGVVEGLVICIISGYLLRISQTNLIQWIGLNVLVMLTFLLVATYLLRQLKMVGMFILLILLSVYFLFTNALTGNGEGGFRLLQQMSPLQHVEMMIANFLQGSGGYGYVIASLVGLLILSFVGNIYVFNRSKESGDDLNEGVHEAN